MRDTFADEDWQLEGPDVSSVLDEIKVCAASLDMVTHHVSLLRDLPQTEKDGLARSLRDLHRRVDDAEVEASSVI